MAWKRKAVDDGSKKKPSTRRRTKSSTDDAEYTVTGKSGSGSEMSRSRPKRNPQRSSARDAWGEEKLLSSTKSRLIDLDLVKLFAKPEAWNCLDKDEKEEIISLLPAHVYRGPDPPTEDGTETKLPPIPESFLRYSNHWRDGVRQFQVDLQNGRYDPEWLRQAEEALQERAEGEFDKFKEEEFEQFWGQKQKLNYGVIAGESSRVKLATLIDEGVIRIGDVWKYSRAFGKGAGRLMVEKEARIVKIDGSRPSFVIPPGQRVFLSQVQDAATHESPQPDSATSRGAPPQTETEVNGTAKEVEESHTSTDGKMEIEDFMESRPDTSIEAPTEPEQGQNSRESHTKTLEEKDIPKDSAVGIDNSPQVSENKSSDIVTQAHHEIADTDEAETDSGPSEKHHEEPSQRKRERSSEQSKQHSDEERSPPSTTPAEGKEILVPNITGPQALVTKILLTDGRMKNPPNGNAWKEIRCYRNNQDMGSLWEVREAWFLRGK